MLVRGATRRSICAALILAAAVFADSAEARQGFGGGRSMGGFSGDRAMADAGPGEWETPVKAGSLVLYAWVWAGNWRGGHWRGGRFWPFRRWRRTGRRVAVLRRLRLILVSSGYPIMAG
jgi:hypothetical protein